MPETICEIQSLPKKLSEEEALEIAKKGGNIFGKLLFGKKEITLKLMYLESREYIFDMTYENAPLFKLFQPNAIPQIQQFCALVEGTSCGASYLEKPLNTQTIAVTEEELQPSTYADLRLLQSGKTLCRRMIRRQIGKNVSIKVSKERKIYRPFYIAFYGELKMGEKVRYLPIPADGNRVERAC